jgi:hypoxanthine-guanine phosphoribosyltransferase
LLGNIHNDVKTKGEFSLKKIHPKHRGLFTDWIKINEDSIRDVTDKNIIVVDDYITSGVTLDEVCTQLLKLSPKSILCLTIIK